MVYVPRGVIGSANEAIAGKLKLHAFGSFITQTDSDAGIQHLGGTKSAATLKPVGVSSTPAYRSARPVSSFIPATAPCADGSSISPCPRGVAKAPISCPNVSVASDAVLGTLRPAAVGPRAERPSWLSKRLFRTAIAMETLTVRRTGNCIADAAIIKRVLVETYDLLRVQSSPYGAVTATGRRSRGTIVGQRVRRMRGFVPSFFFCSV
ncbi:hypothetical protein EVAR_65894_1 [Eumeta japonica]|uniref:Uncharacterized protein n=1 Tax=Eumeta variegata TaxID=151549 RepID=A0A4C2A444_EUMVA|nr:hypothetical protein EVAR_65894_1 [Eumeta japonica]